jgi:hypothetical protein
MPMYVYRRSDGTEFEWYQAITAAALKTCPTTGLACERVPQLPAVHGLREIRSMQWGVNPGDRVAIAEAERVDGCRIDRRTGEAVFDNTAAMRKTKRSFDSNRARGTEERQRAAEAGAST